MCGSKTELLFRPCTKESGALSMVVSVSEIQSHFCSVKSCMADNNSAVTKGQRGSQRLKNSKSHLSGSHGSLISFPIFKNAKAY